MGVHGLWRLIEATGKPVPVETLDGKVLAVDVSIWIHQVLQGYQDRRGNPLPNAHLLGLFNRICKLLYYRIKPVFVFDGGVPVLKKNTIASRRKQKTSAASKALRMKSDLMSNLLKHRVVEGALASENPEKDLAEEQLSIAVRSSDPNDIFRLPLVPSTSQDFLGSDEEGEGESDSSDQLSPRKQSRWMGNIHSVDVNSADFRNLPADVRHDILTDLKETRKQNSWGRLHEIPEESNDFSQYQMKRLLKRRFVQESLEEAEKEMGGKTLTLEELNKLLTEQGIDTTSRDTAHRIAADSKTRMIYINGMKKGKEDEVRALSSVEENTKSKTTEEEPLVEEIIYIDDEDDYLAESEWENDWESDSDDQKKTMSENNKKIGSSGMNPAMAYMLEYSGLTQQQILSVIEKNKIKQEKEEEEEVPLKKSRKSKSNERASFNSNSESDDFVEVENALNSASPNNDSEKNNDESMEREIYCEKNIVSEDSTSQHSGLTQQQITSVIEQNEIKKEKEVLLKKSKEIEPDRCVSLKLNSESDDFIEVDPEPTKSDITKKIILENSTSDTESDDFVQVEDVFIPYSAKKIETGELKITVKPDIVLENDLFADVFASKEPLGVGINSQETIEVKDAVENIEMSTGEIKDDDSLEKGLEEIFGKGLEEGQKSVGEDVSVVFSEKSGEKDAHSRDVAINYVQMENAGIVSEIVENVQPESSGTVTGSLEKEAIKLPVDREELLSMKVQLESEQKDLTGDIGRLQRQATDVTDQMRLEAQELLRLFGIPYVIAPMEAEAQCAHLENISLTDGTITDDSDIWLFGGRCVYKNFFNHNKHVLQFRSSDIQHHFKLTREQMVQLALLVGSDYTTGVTGVGPVTALEILASFPSDGSNLLRGLVNFRCWIKSGRMAGPGRAGLRTKLRNVKIEKGFPSEAVVQAYLTPTVDESKEAFTWNKPNMVLLGDYTREKFGWTRLKFEEILAPVMKKYEEPRKQKGIESYFQVKTSLKSIEGNLSKRVQKAVQRLAFDGPEPDDDLEVAQVQDPQKKKGKPTKSNDKATSSNVKKGKRAKKGEATTSEAQIDLGVPNEVGGSNKIEKLGEIELPVKKVEEVIPQREKDKANALKKKLRAIEVFRKSKKGPGYMRKSKRGACKIKEEADLSESSSSS